MDFDNLPGGTCNGCGTQVTNQYALWGVVFENPNYPGQATAQTNLTFGVPGASGNILWVFQGGGLTDPIAAPFRISFDSGVHRVGFNFASTIDAFLLLEAYNGDQLLESLMFFGSPTAIGWGGFAGLQSESPITRLDVSYHPFSDPSRTLNFSIDNLRFERVSFEPVPEPSSFVFGLLGFAGIAMAHAKKRGSRR